jgi:hypothetical protein
MNRKTDEWGRKDGGLSCSYGVSVGCHASRVCDGFNDYTGIAEQTARSASGTVYFIWPRSMMMKTGTLDIKVNGEVVGKLAPDSYFFIDRKPGTYALGVEPPFDFTYFEADVQIAAGGAYYSINMRSTTVGPLAGGAFVTMNPTPTTGTPMQAKSGTLATYKLRAMDAAAAVVAMKELDSR